MAVDKLVDSAQLDADLSSVANAIRTKGGTSAQLAFPAGFVSAIQNIPSGGGGIDINDFASGAEPDGDITLNVNLRAYAFFRAAHLGKVTMVGNHYLSAYSFGESSITEFSGVDITSDFTNVGTAFAYSQIKKLTAPKCTNWNSYGLCRGCAKLETIDCGSTSFTAGVLFDGCNKLQTLILRSTALVSLGNVALFNNTPLRGYNGLTATIYIPKTLYDHLDDGTADDYKAASNWSTMDAGGYITWAKIEGSYYETHYADGTAISS